MPRTADLEHGALHLQLLAPGTVLANKLRVTRTLGVGGMGTVYEAVHLHLRRKVAVKLIHPGASQSREVRLRFIREAQALAALPLDYIVQVLDVDVLPWGGLYMVMELLDGRDLKRELVKRRTLPVDEASMYIAQACQGVAAAHRAGIIHRDLKPQNLFLTGLAGERRVKLLDFGVAKMGENSNQALTDSHVTVGTPLYMAPEQLNAANQVDERADIWALGIVLYELLAGRTPFRRDTPARTLAAVCLEAVPSLSRHRSDLPPGLEDVIARCLSKEREARFANAEELAAALEPFALTTSLVSVSLQVPRGSSAPPPRELLTAEEFDVHSNELADKADRVALHATIGFEAPAADIDVALTRTASQPSPPKPPAQVNEAIDVLEAVEVLEVKPPAPARRRGITAVAVLVALLVGFSVARASFGPPKPIILPATVSAPIPRPPTAVVSSAPATPEPPTAAATLVASAPTPSAASATASSTRPFNRKAPKAASVGTPPQLPTPQPARPLAGDAVPLTL